MQQAVQDWLDLGLGGRDLSTVQALRNLAVRHVIPALGRRKLRELSAEDVDHWLAEKATQLSTSTVARIKSILARSITRSQARDKVKRNVVLLCGTPTGRNGRPSQALTFDQAQALLDAAPATTMGAWSSRCSPVPAPRSSGRSPGATPDRQTLIDGARIELVTSSVSSRSDG